MTNKQYRQHNAEWFKGKKVRALREIKSRHITIPEGATLTIAAKYSGFELRSERCDHCGVKVTIRKVEPAAVALIDEEEQ